MSTRCDPQQMCSRDTLSYHLHHCRHHSHQQHMPLLVLLFLPSGSGGFSQVRAGSLIPPPTQQTPPRGRRFLTDIAPPFHHPHSSCITVRDYRCHGPGRPSRYTPPCTVWTCWWMAERPQPFTEADSRSTVIAPGGRYWFNVAVSIRVIDDFGPSPGAPASPPPVLAPSH